MFDTKHIHRMCEAIPNHFILLFEMLLDEL